MWSFKYDVKFDSWACECILCDVLSMSVYCVYPLSMSTSVLVITWIWHCIKIVWSLDHVIVLKLCDHWSMRWCILCDHSSASRSTGMCFVWSLEYVYMFCIITWVCLSFDYSTVLYFVASFDCYLCGHIFCSMYKTMDRSTYTRTLWSLVTRLTQAMAIPTQAWLRCIDRKVSCCKY